MEIFTLRDLIEATGGKLMGEGPSLDTVITGVENDNRRVKEGFVFFAMVGENNDGHNYVTQALQNGASGCVVSEEPDEGGYTIMPGKFAVRVKDTIKAFGDLARWYLKRMHIPVIAVTGSVGKTTTKDMIASVLGMKYKVLKTEGNFNNNIGLPITIFRLDHSYDMAVLEMGMNHLGEIEYLVNIAPPDVAVITNIGEAHIGNLGSKENIFRAKCEIFSGLRKGGTAVLNGDDQYLSTIRDSEIPNEKVNKRDYQFRWYGETKECDYRAENVDTSLPGSVRMQVRTPHGTFPVEVPALGHHMLYSVTTALAVADLFDLSVEQEQAGVRSYTSSGKRMTEIDCAGDVRLYDDTYNASPMAMISSLDIMAGISGKRHIAVLGDMLELGRAEEAYHREVGEHAASLGIDVLITVGPRGAWIAGEAEKGDVAEVIACADLAEAQEAIDRSLVPGSVVLFKASHGMHLEKLVSFTQELAEKKFG